MAKPLPNEVAEFFDNDADLAKQDTVSKSQAGTTYTTSNLPDAIIHDGNLAERKTAFFSDSSSGLPLPHPSIHPDPEKELIRRREVFALCDSMQIAELPHNALIAAGTVEYSGGADILGRIRIEELGVALRSLGFNVTEKQIHTWINKYDDTGSGKIDFATFHAIINDNIADMKPPSTAEQIIDAFQVFDMYHTNRINVNALVEMLRSMGEPLTHEDVDNLLLEIDIDGNDEVDIAGFVHHMVKTSYR